MVLEFLLLFSTVDLVCCQLEIQVKKAMNGSTGDPGSFMVNWKIPANVPVSHFIIYHTVLRDIFIKINCQKLVLRPICL